VVVLAALLTLLADAEVSEGPSRFFSPEDGQLDLSEFLATPRSFLPVPLVVTEPAVGYGGGFAGIFFRPRKDAGAQGYARPNLSVLGGIVTANGTKGLFGGDVSRWKADRVKTLVGAGTGKVNLDFYGTGSDAGSLDEPIRYSLDFDLALAQASWRVAKDSPWSVGLRYIYAQVQPQLRDDAIFPTLANSTQVRVSAPAAILEFDSRDNLFTPHRGVYAESLYLASRENLGASRDFERFQQVLMGWLPVGGKVTLGLRADYQWASADTPFFLRPYIGLRGVPAMRFQGDEMASIEGEVQWRVRGRWSAVAAAGYGAARTSNNLFTHTKEVTSAAVGFRYLLANKFGMHAGLDVGFSSETTAIYFQLGNAWFRP
jgi:hypothetical protein